MKEMLDSISFKQHLWRECHRCMIVSENSPARNSPHGAADVLRQRRKSLKEMLDSISFKQHLWRECHRCMIVSENSPARNSPHGAADVLRHKEENYGHEEKKRHAACLYRR